MMDYQNYQRKIVPYIDGSMSAEERSEFEAFVSTHPDFEAQIQTKQDEINLIKSLIPVMNCSRETEASLDTELRTSIYHLLKKEPQTVWEKLKTTVEDWLSR